MRVAISSGSRSEGPRALSTGSARPSPCCRRRPGSGHAPLRAGGRPSARNSASGSFPLAAARRRWKRTSSSMKSCGRSCASSRPSASSRATRSRRRSRGCGELRADRLDRAPRLEQLADLLEHEARAIGQELGRDHERAHEHTAEVTPAHLDDAGLAEHVERLAHAGAADAEGAGELGVLRQLRPDRRESGADAVHERPRDRVRRAVELDRREVVGGRHGGRMHGARASQSFNRLMIAMARQRLTGSAGRHLRGRAATHRAAGALAGRPDGRPRQPRAAVARPGQGRRAPGVVGEPRHGHDGALAVRAAAGRRSASSRTPRPCCTRSSTSSAGSTSRTCARCATSAACRRTRAGRRIPYPVDYSTGSVGLGAAAPLFGALVQRYVDDHGELGRARGRFIS